MPMRFEDYPRPSLTVDPAVLTVEHGRLMVVLARRTNPPFEGSWALPGVFVNAKEGLEEAVLRGLRSKANLPYPLHLEQIFAWNRIGRDPRGWVVTIAYLGLAPCARLRTGINETARADLFAVEWVVSGRSAQDTDIRISTAGGDEVVPAFDHARIVGTVIALLRERIWRTPLSLALLPEEFTLREMQTVFEAILEEKLNKDSFRRRIVRTLRLVVPTGRFQNRVDHRPAELFTGTDQVRPEIRES